MELLVIEKSHTLSSKNMVKGLLIWLIYSGI